MINKKHLVNLLLEEYKQWHIFTELAEKGVDIAGLMANNLDIVLDIIGFPRNSYSVKGDKNEVDFVRDWLHERIYDVYKNISMSAKVRVNINIEFLSLKDEEYALTQLLAFVDWLYDEFKNHF